jgi:hypothetical protein
MVERDAGLNEWSGRELFDAKGSKIGTVAGLGYPRPKFGTTWLLVETAVGKTVLVPAGQVESSGERLTLRYPKTYIEAAPTGESGRRLSRAGERRLCLHYGLDHELPGSGCRQGCGLCAARRIGETAQ